MAKVLCIDNDPIMRLVLCDHIKEIGHAAFEAENWVKGIHILRTLSLDIVMADMNACEHQSNGMKSFIQFYSQHVPFVIYSNENKKKNIKISSDMDAWRYINTPLADGNQLKDILAHLTNKIQTANVQHFQFKPVLATSKHNHATESLENSPQKRECQSESLLSACVQALNGALSEKDPATAYHNECVAQFAKRMATTMGLGDNHKKSLELAGHVLDIGKIATPRTILNKNGPLTLDEVVIIQEHVNCGVRIIRNSSFPASVADTVQQHHERFNGTGYPKKLSGEHILLESRILAIADVYNALCVLS